MSDEQAAKAAKRLAYLEKITAAGTDDAMPWYGLAMEYKSVDRLEDALRTFETLRGKHPEYVAMYLMAGGVLETLDRKDDARAWYEAGIAAARKAGNSHAAGELETALHQLRD